MTGYASHRRVDAVAADRDGGSLERAVLLLVAEMKIFFLLAAEMKILAPGLNSLLSAGALGDPRLPDTSFLILPITFEPFDRPRRQIVGSHSPDD